MITQRLILAAAVSGLVACTPPATTDPAPHKKADAQAVTAPKPPKKPVRLNGRGKVSSISITDAFAKQQAGEALIYDARPPFFYALGHIPGAINLPKANCDEQIMRREAEIKAALAANKTIIVYCTNFACPDARTVAIHLSSFGHPSSTLTGGWDSWKDSGLPTE